jgi:hypothetical protein
VNEDRVLRQEPHLVPNPNYVDYREVEGIFASLEAESQSEWMTDGRGIPIITDGFFAEFLGCRWVTSRTAEQLVNFRSLLTVLDYATEYPRHSWRLLDPPPDRYEFLGRYGFTRDDAREGLIFSVETLTEYEITTVDYYSCVTRHYYEIIDNCGNRGVMAYDDSEVTIRSIVKTRTGRSIIYWLVRPEVAPPPVEEDETDDEEYKEPDPPKAKDEFADSHPEVVPDLTPDPPVRSGGFRLIAVEYKSNDLGQQVAIQKILASYNAAFFGRPRSYFSANAEALVYRYTDVEPGQLLSTYVVFAFKSSTQGRIYMEDLRFSVSPDGPTKKSEWYVTIFWKAR